ncbi:hypothetical protein NHQ30_007753 [Ciborinia camelliae]|nr:hypothetical protein NHQ30_007753 [Ciborinia camelliae]
MELKLSIPNGQPNPSIEVYKLALRYLERAITNHSTGSHIPSHPNNVNSLCNRCAAVSERLRDACESTDAGADEMDLGGSARDASGNLFLGTLQEIFARNDCPLCGLITRQFLRTKRREIYTNARLKEREIRDLTLPELLELSYPEKNDENEDENENDWIVDPFSQVLQLSLNTILSDGIMSIWWPEKTVDEINDEPSQLPMMAADHEATFPGVKPWIALPRGKISIQRDLSMFSKCFYSCLENHGRCRETTTSPGLGFGPSRLIDIEQMKIVCMGRDEIPTYFVLSYVWGRPPFLLLEKNNERDFSTPGFLSTQAIPQTIFDAIEITRHFGIRYLWVDALCIVQDDLENKMHEIDRMHIIYAQAEMTIVAATGDGANSGLLEIDPVFAGEGVHLINGKRFIVDTMEMREVVEFSTWFTRGWTFQELVFSKRIMYVTPERTYYACDEGSWSEDFPLPENMTSDEKEMVFYDESLKTGFDFQKKLNPFENYSSMVSKMSTRQFTQESDCLNACRGFYTGMLLKGLGGSVCGLPAICFEFALAWQPDGNLSRRRILQTSEYLQFPSWSWAGWNGPIDYPFLSSPERCGVICDVRWTVFEAYTTPMIGDDSREECRFKQVVPTIKVHTSPEQSYQSLSSWQTHSYFLEKRPSLTNSRIRGLLDMDAGRKIMSSNFIGPSLLIFETCSITCLIQETSRLPLPLAHHKDLKFFSISHNNTIIGELKIDLTTLNTYLDSISSSQPQSQSHPLSDPLPIELITLFQMDFATTAIQDLI